MVLRLLLTSLPLLFLYCSKPEDRGSTRLGQDLRQMGSFNDLAEKYFSSSSDSLFILSEEVLALGNKWLSTTTTSTDTAAIHLEMIRAYGNMGKLYGDRGSFSDMAASYLEALRLAESEKDTLAIIEMTGNLGSAYRLSHDRATAIRYFQKALELSKSIGDKKLLSKNYNLLGGAYIDLHQNDSARYCMQHALDLKLQIGDSNGIARVYNNLGMIFLDEGMRDSSLHYYRAACDIMRALNERFALGVIYDGISGVLREEGLFDPAERYLDSSMAIGVEIKSDYLKEMIYFSYADLYSRKGDYKKAYENFVKYNAIIDTIRNANNQQKIADLRNRYEKSKKDLAISTLSNENNIINARLREYRLMRNFLIALLGVSIVFFTVLYRLNKRKRIAEEKQKLAEYHHHIAQVEMKALRSQMNTHFLFNTLQSIYDFLEQNKSEKAGEYLLKFSKLMRMVLSAGRKPFVILKDELEALKLYMDIENLRMNTPFAYAIHVHEGMDPEEIHIPSLMLQPLVENSIIHGFSGTVTNGLISIDVSQKDGFMQYSVMNRGNVSISKVIPKKDGQESVGLKILEERLAILSGPGTDQAKLVTEDLSAEQSGVRAYRVVIYIPLSILPEV